MAMSLDDRVRSLESKFWVATGAGLVFAAWFGVNNIYYIPKAAKEAVDVSILGNTTREIETLRDQARKGAEEISNLKDLKMITIDGQCFKPRQIFECFGRNGSSSDHRTWFANEKGDCSGLENFNLEASTFILSKC